MKKNKNGFKSYIVKMYGSQTRMASALGVSGNTVNSWVQKNPLPLLKHSQVILKQCDTTAQELISEVLFHSEELK
jgi:DNA-binding XRE family transcriptional regulator|tara:strand:- start:141 stop:365 length:225 start_codon:yes stop_codon:yes gene_type:complete